MSDDAKERHRAKKMVQCPACKAEAGNRCQDLRPANMGRANRHVHAERVMALRLWAAAQ